MTDIVRIGSEILVNTATAGDQLQPQVTLLSNGGFVVTWADRSEGVGGATGDASDFAVKAQVFAVSGAKIGSEILVNTAAANFQGQPQITPLSGGGFVVTWKDRSHGVGGAVGDTEGDAVKAQAFAADGSKVGSEILVNTAIHLDQGEARITSLSNGGFVVTWYDFSQGAGGATGDNNFGAVKAQTFAADGTKIGTEIRVNTAVVGDQYRPRVTALSNGSFVVTWSDDNTGIGAAGDGSGIAVKAQVFAAGGSKVGSEILVNTATAGIQDSQQITALSNGGFVVTWRDLSKGVGGATGDADGFAVKAQVFAAEGSKVGAEILVNTATAGNQSDALITALPNGGFAVTWWDNSVDDGSGAVKETAVKAQVFAADGSRIGSEILVSGR